MNKYFWCPVEDTAIDDWATGRAAQIMGKILPRVQGLERYPGSQNQSQWTNISNYDMVFICCHGVATSLKQVGWVPKVGGAIKWDADTLTDVMAQNLSLAGKPTGLIVDWQVTACWGANQFTAMVDSFGKRLADAMKTKGFKGTLTAYKGATSLNVYDDFQVGSSRITSGLLHWKDVGVFNSAKMAREGTRSRVGVKVVTKRSDMEVTWQLGT